MASQSGKMLHHSNLIALGQMGLCDAGSYDLVVGEFSDELSLSVNTVHLVT